MNKKLKNTEIDLLFNAILKLETLDECYKFFEDICTVNELQSIAQRFDVARLLLGGKTYTDIGKLNGASTATISRVNRSLNYGSDGYVMVLDRLGMLKDEMDTN